MAITAPIHASLAGSDVARAREWYERNLGWVPVAELPDPIISRDSEGNTLALAEDRPDLPG